MSNIPQLHKVSAVEGMNAPSARYIGPLLGNGELCCFLDEHGVMHDYPALPARATPRIYWAGRRDAERALTPFGYFTAMPSWEWMESTGWEQALDVKSGIVETTHTRGHGSERTETLLLLDRNLFAIHKELHGIKGAPALGVAFHLGEELPKGLRVTGGGQDSAGAWLDYQLDGVTTFCGRIALWADRPCAARFTGNALHCQVSLLGDDAVTLYLAFADDLGDDLLYRQSGWLGRHADHPQLAPIIRELYQRPVTKDDPVANIAALRAWSECDGWAGVRAQQARCWEAFWAVGWIDTPDAPDMQAIWETGMYATRTQLTRWSIPVAIHGNYFNGQYFHDEMAGVQALLVAGHWPLARRCAEHKLSVVPLGMQVLDGTGARGDAPSYEGGHFRMNPMGCSIYEVHASGEPPLLVRSWLRYAGMPREELERYYPICWGAAEFFRRWMVYQGPDGHYFTGACVDFNESVPAVRNGAATVAAAIGSMRTAALLAEMLGRDAELIAQWREISDGLAGHLLSNARGALCQYAGDDGVSFTTLRLIDTGFSPGSVAPNDPRAKKLVELLLAECKTAENWAVAASHDPALAAVSQDVNNPDPVAWTWTPALLIAVLAAMGDGERAMEVVNELIRCSNAFGSLYECKVLTDGFLSLPWFVTSSAELSASISALFIQCRDGRIDLLPAIPASWQKCAFQLAAEDRTTVQVTVEQGALCRLTLHSPSPAPRIVRIPARFQPSALLGTLAAEGDGWQEFHLTPSPFPVREGEQVSGMFGQ